MTPPRSRCDRQPRLRPSWKSVLQSLVAAALVAFGLASPALAQSQLLDEVWVGGFAHDTSDIGHGKESNTQDVMLEVDTGRPGALRFLGAPRIGASIALNGAGLTNFGGLGLVWDHKLFGHIYGSLDLGMGLSDGVAHAQTGAAEAYDERHRLLLGSKVLFREAGGLNWRLSQHWWVAASSRICPTA